MKPSGSAGTYVDDLLGKDAAAGLQEQDGPAEGKHVQLLRRPQRVCTTTPIPAASNRSQQKRANEEPTAIPAASTTAAARERD